MQSHLNQARKIQAERSYYQFVKQAFQNVPSVNKGMPYSDNWHIKFLCDQIQDRIEKLRLGLPCEKLIVNIPPGSMKSIVCTVLPTAWAWATGFPMHHLGLSNAETLAKGHGMQCLDTIKSNWFQDNWAEVVTLKKGSESVTDYFTIQGGRRMSAGMEGTWTGFHFHMISIDDPLDPGDAYSEASRNTAITLIKEKALSRHINPDSFFPLIIAQRVHDQDPPGYFLSSQRDGWEWINLPVDDSEEVFPHHLAENYRDGLLFPERFSRENIDKKRIEYGETAFRCQYLQSPSSKSGEIIKIEYIRTFKPEKVSRETSEHFFGDLAYGVDETDHAQKTNTSDYNVLLGVKEQDGNLYITHRKKDKQSQPEWLKSLLPWLLSTDFRPDESDIRLEPKASGPGIISTLRGEGWEHEGKKYFLNVMRMDLPRDSRNREKGKIARIAAQLHKIESGRLFVPEGDVPYRITPESGDPYEIKVEAWVPDFLETLRRFPKGQHDDDVDALEMALRRMLTGIKQSENQENN